MEEDFEFGKDRFGLDQSQVRLYTAIARHTVLAMAALAICAITAARCRHRTEPRRRCPSGPTSHHPPIPGMIPLTVPEINRLLAGLLTRPPARDTHHRRWSIWRRRHQARARWFRKRAGYPRAESALVSY